MFKNALVSVSDKSGLVEFIKPLAEKGMRVVSTGGTAKHLREAGIEVVYVSDQTGFPEVMDGRVKTLHPRVHMALLARDFVDQDLETLKQHELEPFDLVVGNLYAFEEALKKGIEERELQEFIDIGGPSLLRAAAKNYSRITTVCNPDDYKWILDKSNLELSDRKKLSAKVFSHVSSYDSMVANALSANTEEELQKTNLSFGGQLTKQLRYGENPNQKATWFRTLAKSGFQDCEIIQGKELSYNNLLDLDAAVSTLLSLSSSSDSPGSNSQASSEMACVVAVKHNNPCGAAIDSELEAATKKALEADPVSVFGGIISLNQTVDQKSAEHLSQLFLECVVAPEFSKDALEIFSKKKNLRILKAPQMLEWKKDLKVRSVFGGLLVQQEDKIAQKFDENWKVYGESPSEELKQELMFCWKVCGQLKSNAIALSRNNQTIGLGMGQVNRVDAVEQAIERATKFHSIEGPVVLASDAFFPFPDSIEKAAKAGIKWIIQPGGSVKDDEVIQMAEKEGVNLVMTGSRHFSH